MPFQDDLFAPNLQTQRPFGLMKVCEYLDCMGTLGFNIEYKDIVDVLFDCITSSKAYRDSSMDHFSLRMQSYYELLDVCEISHQRVFISRKFEKFGCATLALAAVRLTLKNSLSSFVEICKELVSNIKASKKFLKKLCLFLNKYNQPLLLFFVSDVNFSLENEVVSLKWFSAKRTALKKILLEKFYGKLRH